MVNIPVFRVLYIPGSCLGFLPSTVGMIDNNHSVTGFGDSFPEGGGSQMLLDGELKTSGVTRL